MKTYTICGSMRFAEDMKKIAYDLEISKGYNILQCVYCEDNIVPNENELLKLADAHYRKIDLSDGIYERGMEQGKEQNMIELVCRKVSKGKSLDTIAAELEEDKDVVLPIYTAVLKSAPDYDINEVYEYLHHK